MSVPSAVFVFVGPRADDVRTIRGSYNIRFGGVLPIEHSWWGGLARLVCRPPARFEGDAGNAWGRMDSQAQIVIDKVNHTYRPPRGRAVLALSDISLEVRP